MDYKFEYGTDERASSEDSIKSDAFVSAWTAAARGSDYDVLRTVPYWCATIPNATYEFKVKV